MSPSWCYWLALRCVCSGLPPAIDRGANATQGKSRMLAKRLRCRSAPRAGSAEPSRRCLRVGSAGKRVIRSPRRWNSRQWNARAEANDQCRRAREDGAREHSELRGCKQCDVGESQRGDENRHREPDTAQCADQYEPSPGHAVWRPRRSPSRTAMAAAATMPSGLPTTSASTMLPASLRDRFSD